MLFCPEILRGTPKIQGCLRQPRIKLQGVLEGPARFLLLASGFQDHAEVVPTFCELRQAAIKLLGLLRFPALLSGHGEQQVALRCGW